MSEIDATRSKHAPGPWEAQFDRNHNPSRWLISANGAVVASVEDGSRVRRYPDPNPQPESNARLISAAPDLLAVCERWAKWSMEHGGPDTQGIACDTFAAVAKANGKEA